MKYLDYRGMKEFYTIDEVCRLFEERVLHNRRGLPTVRNQQAGAQTLRGQVQHSAAGGSVRQLGIPQGSGAKAAQFYLQGAV